MKNHGSIIVIIDYRLRMKWSMKKICIKTKEN